MAPQFQDHLPLRWYRFFHLRSKIRQSRRQKSASYPISRLWDCTGRVLVPSIATKNSTARVLSVGSSSGFDNILFVKSSPQQANSLSSTYTTSPIKPSSSLPANFIFVRRLWNAVPQTPTSQSVITKALRTMSFSLPLRNKRAKQDSGVSSSRACKEPGKFDHSAKMKKAWVTRRKNQAARKANAQASLTTSQLQCKFYRAK